jgi:hypothetical protein
MSEPGTGVGAPVDDEVERFERAARAKRKMLGFAALAVVLAAAIPTGWWFLQRAQAALEDAEPPLIPDSARVVAGVPVAEVHEALMPDWVVELGRGTPGNPAYSALHAAAAGNPELQGLVSSMFDSTVRLDREQGVAEQAELVDRWNEWMRTNNAPYVLQLPMGSRLRYQQFMPMTYYVAATFSVPGEVEPVPVDFLTRLDPLNLVEGYAGHVREGSPRATVLVEQVTRSATWDIWPMLDPELDSQLPAHLAAIAPRVRTEIQALLSPADFSALQRTAGPRLQFMQQVDQIQSRIECGGGFEFLTIPLRGYSDEMLLQWRENDAEPDNGRSCPGLTFSELDAMREASAALRGVPGVRQAAYALVAAVGRGVAIHEVQHSYDLHVDIACNGCGISAESILTEASAYAASFADPAIGWTTLYLSCVELEEISGQHGFAVYAVLDAMNFPECEGTLPENLSETVQAMRMQWWGRAPQPTLPADYPASIRSARL